MSERLLIGALCFAVAALNLVSRRRLVARGRAQPAQGSTRGVWLAVAAGLWALLGIYQVASALTDGP